MMLCKYPIFLEQAGGIVPCGQCHHCRKNRRRQKTTRLTLEAKTTEHVLFVTLTYKDEFLPRDIYDLKTGEVLYSHPSGCLDKRAIQLFNKRIRRELPSGSYRFFACGEYGEKNTRPHYHMVMFGLPYERRDLIYKHWTDPVTKEPMCDPNYLDVQIPKKDWDVGQYCCSYVMKKMTKPDDPRLEGRPPEFFTSSKGIGLGFVEKFADSLSKFSAKTYILMHGDIPREIVMDGKRMPLDRYMREKILEKLQISEEIKAHCYENYQEEMLSLQTRAKSNKEIPQAWLLDPKRIGWAMEKQFVAERSQQMKNSEHRDAVYNSRKGEKL